MYEFNTTITASGESVFMQIISTSGTAYFSRLIFSENNYVGQEHSLNILTFDGVFDSRSASATIIDSRNIKVSAAINAPTQDNTLYSIGVVVRYQGLDYLAAVCTTSNPMPISQGAGNTYSFNINISVSSTENITVVGTTAAALYDTDIVDNLATVDPTKVLSANMGHAIGDNLAANENVYGAKQMIPYPYYETTKTENGITFTDNGNGTVTVSGTASADTVFYCLASTTKIEVEQIINGCPSGGTDTSYRLVVTLLNQDDSYYGAAIDYGSGALISDLDKKIGGVFIQVFSGTAITTPITFKPMIRDARVIDPTFAPYAMTNRELTELVDTIDYTVLSSSVSAGFNTFDITSLGVGGYSAYVMCIFLNNSGNFTSMSPCAIWDISNKLFITSYIENTNLVFYVDNGITFPTGSTLTFKIRKFTLG